MTSCELNNKYFNWMCKLVGCNHRKKELSYKRLLTYLYRTEFVPLVKQDINRAIDGRDLRYRFGSEYGLLVNNIEICLDSKECSILEMMVALAVRCEVHIMGDDKFGNRTGKWFGDMIYSLGLSTFTDFNYDDCRVIQIVDDFINRNYSFNGEGGLFTVNNPRQDMRNTEIWYQMCWYLNEIIDKD